ncbi:hypothetical protein E2562_029181 [Oryza meyeriana var. granulata]|uniref:Uncharacterized protein n=1 Tax=Oryza meyeriana var. granulata TaxID=110450 RepID=A0A6G1C0J5_9ORYZ|nr:hypothetical protein E2562_029181 [Oryza meyeriana var. granulata]
MTMGSHGRGTSGPWDPVPLCRPISQRPLRRLLPLSPLPSPVAPTATTARRLFTNGASTEEKLGMATTLDRLGTPSCIVTSPPQDQAARTHCTIASIAPHRVVTPFDPATPISSPRCIASSASTLICHHAESQAP